MKILYNAFKNDKLYYNWSGFCSLNGQYFDRSMEDVARYRDSFAVSVIGDNVPNPIIHFAEVNFPDYVMKEIKWVNNHILSSLV